MQRPLVSVFNHKDRKEVVAGVKMPHVFLAPIRDDLVSFVHDQLSKNSRQAHGVDKKAGMRHSAESWGTGRAVARIPRVQGSGSGRSGQAAFGNMCRKGRMAHPLQTWRRYHRKVNVRQRRHALASAIAATASFPLVWARGHMAPKVPQVPLVVDDAVSQVARTKDCIAFLKNFGLWEDCLRVRRSRKLRAGKGKMRDRRFKLKKGPLFVVDEGAESLRRGLRNIVGVDIMNVNRLNIRGMAPGGHMGRLCVWTKQAFSSLENHFGSFKPKSALTKNGYALQRSVLKNADVTGIINSDAVQKALRDAKPLASRGKGTRANPLKNRKAMDKLNPYAKVVRTMRQKEAGVKHKISKAERQTKYKRSKVAKGKMQGLLKRVDQDVDALTDIYKGQISSMNVA